MKILPNLHRKVSRYMKKNTISGKYERNMDAATVSGIAAVSHGITTGTIPGLLPITDPTHLFINISLWGIYFKSLGSAVINKIKLIPIKKRAKAIKKVAKRLEKEARIAQKETMRTQKKLNKQV